MFKKGDCVVVVNPEKHTVEMIGWVKNVADSFGLYEITDEINSVIYSEEFIYAVSDEEN